MSNEEDRRKISCLDLKAQHQQLKQEIFKAFENVYDSTAFSGGPFVEAFETAFAAYLGTAWAVGVSNGTVALHLAMSALEIGPGDEVIIPANTFIATAWGVSHAGATPVFVDCDADTWEIDAAKAAAAVTGRTRAIIGVHLYGQPFDVEAVRAVCGESRIALVEDAAQAHGARYKGARAGTFGEMACFSFYPGKNLGACGEAGAVTTGSESIAMRLRSLRNHGSSVRYYHDEIGYNYRMGGLEGASLRVKLRYLDGWNDRRRAIAMAYRREIQNPKIRMQHSPSWVDPVHHLFVVTTEERDDFVRFLQEQGIFPAFHYPVPCHLQKAYAHLGYQPGHLPNAEYLAAHCVSLPMYPELTEAEVREVIRVVNAY
jgi:dTDP-4-amino-4,6-dideoxygalactose transaminase